MNRKIRKYFLVVGTVYDGPHGFTDRVWKMIEKGFEPLGGIAITSRPINGRPCEIFAQAMALYDDTEMDPNLEAYLAEQTAEASTVAGSTRSPAEK